MNEALSKLILLRGQNESREFLENLNEPQIFTIAIRNFFTNLLKIKNYDHLSTRFSVSKEFFKSLEDREILISDCYKFLLKKIRWYDSEIEVAKSSDQEHIEKMKTTRARLTGIDYNKAKARKVVHEMFRAGQSIDAICRRLEMNKSDVNIILLSSEFDFPMTHTQMSKIKQVLPRLTCKTSLSYYTYMPQEAIRLFIRDFMTPDKAALRTTHGIGPKSQNEIKFLLYDMYLTGLSPEQISEKTGLDYADIWKVYDEVQLTQMIMGKKGRPQKLQAHDDFDQFAMYYEIYNGDMDRLYKNFEHWGWERFHACKDVYLRFGKDRVAKFQKAEIPNNQHYQL